MTNSQNLQLNCRRQILTHDAGKHHIWQEETMIHTVPAAQTAIIICDMWDKHWSRGATERVEAMAPKMNQVIKAARARGVQIIHAPSDTLDFYADTPARQRMIEAPVVDAPLSSDYLDLPLPIDDSDEGSDTGEKNPFKAWRRQHPRLEIDQESDGISENGLEIYNFIQQQSIKQLIIMGVHTNMCILNRSFGIKQMVRWGMDIVLVRDLTDSMYNPARPPYVSHDEGTRLVVGYIEKYWCPTITSTDLI